MTTTVRCAVYTRKSSEEGLEQSFNSLDAQREAGLDYIKSQRHQSWTAINAAYDDGGFSGGSTDRPGLQRLLDDIKKGRVDVVVVYKVDRLSRSLSDFARLMQLFEEQKVSFVSVTQQFNTTSSMGRLTLNMLLSFAQFEREITGERIRDKIAASKKKGIWITGQPPIGYRRPGPGEDQAGRRLLIVKEQAAVVRLVFTSYLELRSLLGVAKRLNDLGHTTRRWQGGTGRQHGGSPFSARHVYKILTNPAYLGKVTHTRGGKTEIYPGRHDPIIEQPLWDKVHSVMGIIERQVSTRWTHTHLLKGKIRTFEDFVMTPSSLGPNPKQPNRKRTRYYLSQKAQRLGYATCPIKMVNARHLDDLVRALVVEYVEAGGKADLRSLEPADRDHRIRDVIERVTVGPERLEVRLDRNRVEVCRLECGSRVRGGAAPGRLAAGQPGEPAAIPKCLFTPEVEVADHVTTLTIHIQLKRHDHRRVMLAPDGRDLYLAVDATGEPVPQPHLVRALGLAFGWHRELLRTDVTIESIAKREKVTAGRVRYLLHLARLGPEVVRAVLTGRLARVSRSSSCTARPTGWTGRCRPRHCRWTRQPRRGLRGAPWGRGVVRLQPALERLAPAVAPTQSALPNLATETMEPRGTACGVSRRSAEDRPTPNRPVPAKKATMRELAIVGRRPTADLSGEGGIRTPDTVARIQHFQCCSFSHSDTSPKEAGGV